MLFKTGKLTQDLKNFKKCFSPQPPCKTYLDHELTKEDCQRLFEMDSLYKAYIQKMIGSRSLLALLFVGYLIAKKTGSLKVFGIHWSILNYVCSQQPFIIFCHLMEFTFQERYSGEEIMAWLKIHLDDFSAMEKAFKEMPKTTDRVLYTDCFLFSVFLDLETHADNYIIPLFQDLADFYYGMILKADPEDKADLFTGNAPFFQCFDFLDDDSKTTKFKIKPREEIVVVSESKVYQYISSKEKVLKSHYSTCINGGVLDIISAINHEINCKSIDLQLQGIIGEEDIGACILKTAYIQTSNFVIDVMNLINQHFVQNHGYSYYTGTEWKYAEFEDTAAVFTQITGIKLNYKFSTINLKNKIQHPPCPFLIPENDGTVLNFLTNQREISSPAIIQITRVRRDPEGPVDEDLQLQTFTKLYAFHHEMKYTSSLQLILYHPLVLNESGSYSVFDHFVPTVEFHTIEESFLKKEKEYLPTPVTVGAIKAIIREMDDLEILLGIIKRFPSVSIGLLRIFHAGVDSTDYLEELFSVENPIFGDFVFHTSGEALGGALNFLESIERMSVFDEYEEENFEQENATANWPSIIPKVAKWTRESQINIDKFHCIQALRSSLMEREPDEFDWESVPVKVAQDIVTILVFLCRKNPKSNWYCQDLKNYFQLNKSKLNNLVEWTQPIIFRSTDQKMKRFCQLYDNFCENSLYACELFLQFASHDLQLLIYLLTWIVSIGCVGNFEKTFLLILGSSNCGKSKLVEHLYYIYNSGTPHVISNATIQDSPSELNSSALPATQNFFVNIDEFKKGVSIIINKLVSDTPQSYRIMKTQKFQTLQPLAKLILTTNEIPHLDANEGLKTRMHCLRMHHSYRKLLPNGVWEYRRANSPGAMMEYGLQGGRKMFPIGINERKCQEGLVYLLAGLLRALIRKNTISPVKYPSCERIIKDTNYVFSALDPYTKYMTRTKLFNGKIRPTKVAIEHDVNEINKLYRYHWDQEVVQSIVETCISEMISH